MRTLATGIIFLVMVATAPASGYPLPRDSEGRAQRYQTWRVEVEKGERAMAEGRWGDAEPSFVKVIEESRAIDDRSLLLARALDRMGDLRRRDEHWQDAERMYLEAAELWEKHLGPEQPRLAITLHNLGVVYIGQERFEDARATLRRALVIIEQSLGAETAQAADTRLALQANDRRARSPRP